MQKMNSQHSYNNDDSQYEYSWPEEEDKDQNTYSNNFGDEPSYDHFRANVKYNLVKLIIYILDFCI